jgi:AraC-like DNA-binding protein
VPDFSDGHFRTMPKHARKGVPDITLIRKPDGRYVGIEVKTATGRLSPEQQIAQPKDAPGRILRAVGWIRDNHNTRLRIEALCDASGMSRARLRRHFLALTRFQPPAVSEAAQTAGSATAVARGRAQRSSAASVSVSLALRRRATFAGSRRRSAAREWPKAIP